MFVATRAIRLQVQGSRDMDEKGRNVLATIALVVVLIVVVAGGGLTWAFRAGWAGTTVKPPDKTEAEYRAEERQLLEDMLKQHIEAFRKEGKSEAEIEKLKENYREQMEALSKGSVGGKAPEAQRPNDATPDSKPVQP